MFWSPLEVVSFAKVILQGIVTGNRGGRQKRRWEEIIIYLHSVEGGGRVDN